MTIADQVAKLGAGPLTEAGITEFIHPLFSQTLANHAGIYLANHSLGRPLDQTADDVAEFARLWATEMDGAWTSWTATQEQFRAAVAHLIGLPDGKLVVPKTSCGQGLRAVLNALPQSQPIRIVATTGEFDSVDFILKAYAESGRAVVQWVSPSGGSPEVPCFRGSDLLHALEGDIDLLVISHTFFTTGQIIPDLAEIIAHAHALGARVIVDAYHGVGVVPVDMVALDADFMIGGSYKYLLGGPGACWLAIHPRQLHLRTLDTGWFAKRDLFAYHRSDRAERADGGDGWLESTPPAITVYQARAGQELINGLGVERLRTYHLAQLQALRMHLQRLGLPVHVPDDPHEFGAFLLLSAPDPAQFARLLSANGVTVDARGRSVRFGPNFLNSTESLERAAEITARTYASG